MEITLRPIESLTPYADNAKIHDAKQIANVPTASSALDGNSRLW